MGKGFKEFIEESHVGVDTYDRNIKKLVKEMDLELKSREIEFEYEEGYNSAWFRFLGYDVYVQGLAGGRQYMIYKNKRADIAFQKAKHVINYIQTGSPM